MENNNKVTERKNLKFGFINDTLETGICDEQAKEIICYCSFSQSCKILEAFKNAEQLQKQLSDAQEEKEKWKVSYNRANELLGEQINIYRSLLEERDSIKAKGDKLVWWVDNYISGEKKTDYGDLCEALTEYKGGDNGK